MNAGIPSQQSQGFLTSLVDKGILNAAAAERAKGALATSGQAFDTVMTELGLMREEELAGHLASYLDLPPAGELRVDNSIVADIRLSFLADHALLPLAIEGETLVVAVADPFLTPPIEALAFHCERDLELRVLPRRTIIERIDALKNSAAGPSAAEGAVSEELGSEDLERLRDFAREAPVVRFVTDIINRGVDAGATDIHIEPLEDQVRIRFRQDGMLSVAAVVPGAMLAGISTRIKILARLNIAERRMPQDGRMRMAVRGQEIDLRVSVMPSIHGETIVLRILDRTGVEMRLGSLGFDDAAQEKIRRLASLANGIVLVTGPTGSGKTTTLYSILAERANPQTKIFTVEDPVEYRLPGVIQMQVNPAIDLDFATALRSILRQNPNIILVGEIRDRETAQVAIQAALTGHLVFSTLHTNSAAGALTRLQDMGVDRYLLGATIRGVVAQRLLRRACSNCAGKVDQAPSCKTCNGTGYRGQTVSYEILEVTPEISGLINRAAPEPEIENAACAAGMVAMDLHAQHLVTEGVTTRAEIARVMDFRGIS